MTSPFMPHRNGSHPNGPQDGAALTNWSALGLEEPGLWTDTLLIGEEDSVGRRGGPGRRESPAELRRRVVDAPVRLA